MRSIRYIDIAAEIRQRIINGVYRVDGFLPPERELMKEYQASRPVIRRALHELAREGLVESRPGAGNIVIRKPDPLPEIRLGAMKTAALVMPVCPDSAIASLISCVESTLARAGYQLLICGTVGRTTQECLNKENDALRSLTRIPIHGIVLWYNGGIWNLSAIEEVLNHRIPLVLIDHEVPGIDLDCVMYDNYHGAYEATEYLIKMGHSRIGFVTTSNNLAHERRRGYMEAIQAHGIEPDPFLIQSCNDDVLDDYIGAQMLMQNPCPPSAIIAVNSFVLRIVRTVLDGLGITPDQIPVVSFRSSSEYRAPGVISVDLPTEHMAQQAADLLLKRMAGDMTGGPTRIVLPMTLTINKTYPLRSLSK